MSPNGELSVEPARSGFATTHWSAVAAAGGGDSSLAHPALERVCRAYWDPLYAHVLRQGKSPEDAKDLVQDFFARFLENNSIRLADRSRGRFRSFLLFSLKNFLINEWSRANRLKRGGAVQIASMDETTAESGLCAETAAEQPPDTLYDRDWALVLIQRAMVALEAELQDPRRRELFERLRPFVWGESSGMSYAQMAGQLGMSEGAVKVAVHRLRQRYGELLRQEVAETVSTPFEVEEELRYLVAVIRSGLTEDCNLPG